MPNRKAVVTLVIEPNVGTSPEDAEADYLADKAKAEAQLAGGYSFDDMTRKITIVYENTEYVPS